MILTDEILLQYKRCSRKAFLNFHVPKEEQPPVKDFVFKLKQERSIYTEHVLKHYDLSYQIPQASRQETHLLTQETLGLMKQGVDCIYNGQLSYDVLGDDDREGFSFIISPTLLIRKNRPSNLGEWSYISVNINLGKNPKPEYKLVAIFQGFVLGEIQGLTPFSADFICRNFKYYQVNFELWLPRLFEVIEEIRLLLKTKKEPEVFISRQKCSLCEWYGQCHAIALQQNHLSLIPGITPKKYQKLIKEGINNFDSLTQLSTEKLSKILKDESSDTLYKQIQSLKLNQAIVKRENIAPIPSSTIELYFDIEAEPDRQLDYLLGIILIDYEKNKQEYYYFLAENLEEEKKIWKDFLTFINQYPRSYIYHFSGYEIETIKRLAHLYKTPSHVLQTLLKRLVDVHKIVTQNYVLPVESYSLKSLGKGLNFRWRNPHTGGKNHGKNNVGGYQCVVWYDQWLATGDRTYLEYILTYNEDDCLATFELKKWLNKN